MVWAEFTKAIRKLQRGQLWRHNVSGDLPHNGLGDIDAAKVEQLVDANRGRKGYTYTHHPLNADTFMLRMLTMGSQSMHQQNIETTIKLCRA